MSAEGWYPHLLRWLSTAIIPIFKPADESLQISESTVSKPRRIPQTGFGRPIRAPTSCPSRKNGIIFGNQELQPQPGCGPNITISSYLLSFLPRRKRVSGDPAEPYSDCRNVLWSVSLPTHTSPVTEAIFRFALSPECTSIELYSIRLGLPAPGFLPSVFYLLSLL